VPSRRNHRYSEARDLVHGSIAALIAERPAIHETDWPNDLLSRLMEAHDASTCRAGPRSCSRRSTHRHPDFWTDPDPFDPDRRTRDAETTRHGHSYYPFAVGPRICIGNNFSLLESHLLLAILARRFRPHLRDGFVPHFVMHGTLSIEGDLPAVIETR